MYAKTLPSRFDSLCKKCGKRSDQYTKSEYSERVCKFVDRVIIEKRYDYYKERKGCI